MKRSRSHKRRRSHGGNTPIMPTMEQLTTNHKRKRSRSRKRTRTHRRKRSRSRMHGGRKSRTRRRSRSRRRTHGGRARTRGSLKRAKKSYRRRRKLSHCRGKGPAVCRSRAGCKYASGKKRSFCRKSKSRRRRR